MFRVAWKSLLARKVRLLMSTFAIVLGVAFVCGSLVFGDMLNRSFTAIFASSVGDVVVRPEGGTTAEGLPSSLTVPADMVADLEPVDGAARVDGNVSADGVFVVDQDGKLIGGTGAPGFGINWTDAPAGHGIEGLSIIDGSVPEGPDEVALDARTADKGGYEVGDQVPVVTSGAEPRLELTLVGIADFADGGSLNGASLTIFDTATTQSLFLEGEDAYTDLWVTAEDGVSQEELRDAVAAELPDGVEALTGDDAADESANSLLDDLGFITTFLLIFAGIALVVGAFLIVNTFSILVAQRSRELALLRAMGASRKQVTRAVLMEAFVVGMVGSTIGLGLGMLLALAIKALFASIGLDLAGQSLVLSPRTVLAAYGVGVVVTMAAAWLPARRTARIAPVQALRDDVALPESAIHRRLLVGVAMIVVGVALLGAGLFLDVPRPGWFVGAGVLSVLLGTAAASPVIGRPFLVAARHTYARALGSVGNLAGQNALRNPRRTTATASALMIGLALAATMAILGSSAKASIDKLIEDNFVGDYVVGNVIGQGFSAGIADEMREVDGVEELVAVRFAPTTLDGDVQYVSAIDPSSLNGLLQLDMLDGESADLGDDTVLLSESWASDHDDPAVGDELTFEMPAGDTTVTVAGVFEDNPIVDTGVMFTIDRMRAGGYPNRDNQLLISTDGSAGVQDRLNEVVADIPVVTVKDQEEFAQQQREPIDQLVLIIYGLLALALVIAVLGIVNTLALSVIERTREVGLLRAIGLSRSQLRRMIALESIVIAVLGALLGVVLGIFFGVVLLYSLRDEGLEVITLPYGQLVIFLVLSVVIGLLAAFFPARRAARLDVLRAIATE